MSQFMQQNFLLYGMAVAGILGAASQVILRIVYDKLIRDMKKPVFAKGKYMKNLKQKYSIYRRIQNGSDSISIFIRKSMMEFKYMGMNLHTWSRVGGYTFALCAAMGAAGWYLAGTADIPGALRQNYLWAILASGLLIAGAYGVTDTGYRRKYLETGLRSLFINNSTQAAEPVNLSQTAAAAPQKNIQPKETATQQKRTAAKAAPEPMKKRGRIMESKAQRDKRELKNNLARIKEGMAETAAAERAHEKSREQNTEILRQMDPSEQERVIREVLKEFL